MKTGRKWLLIALVASVATGAGFEFGRWFRAPGQTQPRLGSEDEDAVAQLLTMPFTTPDGVGKKLRDWQGKVLVINFWATWCPPCREEMPELSRAQERYGPDGVQFVGIAIDNVSNVVEFSKKTSVAYPLLIAPSDLPGLTVKLGNPQQALPFTVIVGRDGKFLFSHLGPLTEADLAKQLAPLL